MRIPDRAAVSTSVDLARTMVPAGRADGAAKFVNGVLRGLARSLPTLPWPDRGSDLVRHLSLTTGHPDWIVRDLLDQYEADAAEAILHADNDPPGVTLRAVGDRDELLDELRSAGLHAEPTAMAPEGVRVPAVDPRRLPAVMQGRAVPQDEASMLVVHGAAVAAGDRVVDLCAGPGGKTSHLASLVGPTGSVTAVELHGHRARRIRDLTSRLGHDVTIVEGDARTVALPTGVDAVLVDAPCTGLGVGRRRPEVRWRRQPEDVGALADLQVELLARASGIVRDGGTVTYAVCTWTRKETIGVTERIETAFPDALRREHSRQLLPSTDDTDGMYVARWRVRAH
jgi:16S rRNA (cytosine967-C5)-methyltransferase